MSKTIKKHAQGIIDAMKNNLNNEIAEGLNNKIKTTFKKFYGLKMDKYRSIMVYLMVG